MIIIEQKYMLEKLEKNLLYLNTVEKKNYDEELIVNMILECIDCCNKVNLIQERKQIIKIIDRLGYKDDIRFKIGLDKPYLYIDNDTYSKNEYFTGKYSKNIINYNKNFSYRYQYDKYIINTEYFENNKYDVDFVIRNYKNILLNTNDERLKKLCIEKINWIFEKHDFFKYADDRYTKIIDFDNKSDNDLISIVLTSYNQGKYIESAILSILNQTYNNIEFILMDDCSKDFDIDYYKDFIINNNIGNMLRLIIVKNKKNLGTVSNIHKGISMSSGKFIKFLGGDDMLDNESVVEEAINFMNKTNSLVLDCRCEIYDKNMKKIEEKEDRTQKRIESISRYKSFVNDKYKVMHRLNLLREGSLISIVSTFFENSLFKNYVLLEEKYLRLEDLPIFKNLIINNIEFEFSDIICTRYRLGGITSKNNIENSLIGKEFGIFYTDFFNMLQENQYKKLY